MKKTIIFLMKWILFVFLMMIGVMATLYGIFVAQLKFSGAKEYIMFISPNINIYFSMLIFLPIAALIGIKMFKVPTKEILDNKLNLKFLNFIKKKRKMVYSIVIIFYCLMLFYALTNYCIIYKNSIKRHTIFHPLGKNYQWNDVKDVKVGIEVRRKEKYEVYYILEFSDNSSINLFQTHQSDKEVHDTLLDIDNIVKEKNINKVVDKSNLEHYGKGLADKYIQKTKMLFSE